jgi:hypothetical protein
MSPHVVYNSDTMGRKKGVLQTSFPHEFIKEMKIYCAHKELQLNELIEAAVRDYMKRNPVS